MKRHLVSVMLCMFLVMGVIIPLAFADVPLTNRFDETGHYGIVAAGVGLMDNF